MRQAKWNIGQLVHHKLFGYRGVIYDVDYEFMLSEEWYEQVARSHPPRDEPWYHILVDGSEHETYVAQCNIESDLMESQVQHPLVQEYFTGFQDGHYTMGQTN
jgi:heat shock protein HspQ